MCFPSQNNFEFGEATLKIFTFTLHSDGPITPSPALIVTL